MEDKFTYEGINLLVTKKTIAAVVVRLGGQNGLSSFYRPLNIAIPKLPASSAVFHKDSLRLNAEKHLVMRSGLHDELFRSVSKTAKDRSAWHSRLRLSASHRLVDQQGWHDSASLRKLINELFYSASAGWHDGLRKKSRSEIALKTEMRDLLSVSLSRQFGEKLAFRDSVRAYAEDYAVAGYFESGYVRETF